MIVLKSVSELREWRRAQGENTLGFVPTMGALHEGHLSLMEAAQSENALTLVSIFVNPLQFNNPVDLEKYPRTWEHDLHSLQKQGVSAVFAPTVEDLYPGANTFRVTEKVLSQVLEGEHRPGHFEGMLTVVLKLLMLASADRAYFGEKDFQQQLLVKHMCQEFFIPTEIKTLPTFRRPGGLAESSRNQRLVLEDQQHLNQVYSALKQSRPLSEIQSLLEEQGFKVEYLEERWDRRLIAFEYKNVRFIDNVAKPGDQSR